MSQPSRSGHASMPRFVAWVQDNLLLTLLIIASGFANGTMMIDGWVSDLQDPATWGLLGTFGVAIFFAAGLGMGGLSVRISYKLNECYANRQWGRVVFMACGMAVFASIEFWASFSQRAAHIHLTPADNALLGVLNVHNPAVSLTAILISVVIPFASIFWGFAAEDPAPKALEDAATLKQRLENAEAEAQHKARMMAIRTKGARAAVRAAMGKEEEQESSPNDEPLSAESGNNGGAIDEESAVDDGTLNPDWLLRIGKNWWRWQELQAWIRAEFGLEISEDVTKDIIKKTAGSKPAKHAGNPIIASIGRAKQKAISELNLKNVRSIGERKVANS